MANSERDRLIKLLKDNGWILLRQRGSHCQFVHPNRPDKITIPNKIKKNIELSVRRQLLNNTKKGRR
ncbi:type II toxin-antitoxin system HicA family toxin [Candidatus Saccharibacteria bacterium]|nr:type II toxin-antitoxin system HicA family toxin [Candidatus Saccharibacteria bacterium]